MQALIGSDRTLIIIRYFVLPRFIIEKLIKLAYYTHPLLSSCILLVYEDTSRQRHRSGDQLDWDMLTTEAEKIRKYSTDLK